MTDSIAETGGRTLLSVTIDGFWEPGAKEALESGIRSCISEPPGESWQMTISAGSSSEYYPVLIITSRQQRERYFFDIEKTRLAKVICEWLNSYPIS